MPIDDDIPNILELEDDEKLIHTLHRTFLSFAIPFIFGIISFVLMIFLYIFGNLTELIMNFQFIIPFLFSLPFIIIVVVVAIGVVLGIWYARGHLFLITNKRILFYTKFVTKNLRELRYKKITDSVFSQGPFGRLFNYSSITLSTPGMEGGSSMQGMATFFLSIKGIRDGLTIRKDIMTLLEAAEGS